jgi:multiple antibiotic resistance protein
MLTRAFVPLATPLLAGPGAIATAVVFRETLGGVSTVGAIVAVLAFTAVLFGVTTRIFGTVGRTPVLIMAKIVGILLTAVAVQLIFRGLGAVL